MAKPQAPVGARHDVIFLKQAAFRIVVWGAEFKRAHDDMVFVTGRESGVRAKRLDCYFTFRIGRNDFGKNIKIVKLCFHFYTVSSLYTETAFPYFCFLSYRTLKATPRNERLKPLLHACLHLFRHIAQKCSAIQKVLPALLRQSDEKI
jgi:hypothetical protein